MALLDRLKGVVPEGKTYLRRREQYDSDLVLFVKKHFDEIATARDLEYSWLQIASAIREETNQSINTSSLNVIFYILRRLHRV